MQGIDAAMTKLGDKRVDLGRYRDRMVDHLSDAARSQQLTDVRDASQAKDLAAELRDTMGATSKTQLGIAALSTSNQATQAVLSLLR